MWVCLCMYVCLCRLILAPVCLLQAAITLKMIYSTWFSWTFSMLMAGQNVSKEKYNASLLPLEMENSKTTETKIWKSKLSQALPTVMQKHVLLHFWPNVKKTKTETIINFSKIRIYCPTIVLSYKRFYRCNW